jgi:hypothetical protein
MYDINTPLVTGFQVHHAQKMLVTIVARRRAALARSRIIRQNEALSVWHKAVIQELDKRTKK